MKSVTKLFASLLIALALGSALFAQGTVNAEAVEAKPATAKTEVKEAAQAAEEKVEEAVQAVEKKVEEAAQAAEEKVEGAVQAVKEKAATAKTEVKEAAQAAEEKVEEAVQATEEKVGEAAQAVKEKVEEAAPAVKEQPEEVAKAVKCDAAEDDTLNKLMPDRLWKKTGNKCAVKDCGGKVITWAKDNKGAIGAFAFGVVASLIVSLVIAVIFKLIAKCALRKNQGNVGSMVSVGLTTPLWLAIFLLGSYASSAQMLASMNSSVRIFIVKVFWTVFALVILWAVFRVIAVLDSVLRNVSAKLNSSLNEAVIGLIRKTLKVFVAAVIILFICQNILHLNVSTLLAGAGIIGLAIAFAAQNSVANFISSVIVILDKPFVVGDRVKVAGVDGMVEEVGLRSTKIRTLDGTLFSVPNSAVADNPIENFARRPNLKLPFDITLTYQTTPEQMQQAMDILHKLLDNHEHKAQAPVIGFGEFRDWALVINVICWFNCDWPTFLKDRSALNLAILREFNAAGLEFAYPTNTTYMINTK